jgi:hypothetical protein
VVAEQARKILSFAAKTPRGPSPSEAKMTKLSEQVNDARQLLDFAVSEGHPVEEEVIRVIHQTEDSLQQSGTSAAPEKLPLEQRVAFATAYSKPVNSLDSITKNSLVFSFKVMNYIWYGMLAVFATLFVVKVAFLVIPPGDWAGADRPMADVSLVAILLTGFLVLFVLWFINVFTGVLTKKRKIQTLIFCYSFTIVALLILIMPFFIGDKNVRFYKSMRHGPIGVLNGCSTTLGDSWVTQELKCTNESPESPPNSQWVLNIGGAISQPGSGVDGASVGQSDEDDNAAARFEIHGGLVVPIYVIFLAVLGGIVSMTRRVPEYQRLAHLGKNDPEYFSSDKVREMLVFQLMQVISAPLIAITAYYMVNPASMTTSVVISFGSGFASETILTAIRTMVDKLNDAMSQPGQPPTPPADPADTPAGDAKAAQGASAADKPGGG